MRKKRAKEEEAQRRLEELEQQRRAEQQQLSIKKQLRSAFGDRMRETTSSSLQVEKSHRNERRASRIIAQEQKNSSNQLDVR